jgi:hypothetical protein
MTENVHRQTFCPDCNDSFRYQYPSTAQTDTQLIIQVSCPFCKRMLKVDLSPYATRKVVAYKSDKGNENNHDVIESEIQVLELPDELIATLESANTQDTKDSELDHSDSSKQ